MRAMNCYKLMTEVQRKKKTKTLQLILTRWKLFTPFVFRVAKAILGLNYILPGCQCIPIHIN